MAIHRWNAALDGQFSEAALRVKLERLGYHIARYVYPPGTVFPDHKHGVDKVDAVVSGTFRLVIGGHVALLGPGDWADVPRGTVHNAVVQGDDPVVSFDAIRIDPRHSDGAR
jgi:quercetin dioxygenase-like cupin family protein